MLREAAELLNGNLIWSEDFELIRYSLAGLLEAIDEGKDPEPYADDIAKELLDRI